MCERASFALRHAKLQTAVMARIKRYKRLLDGIGRNHDAFCNGLYPRSRATAYESQIIEDFRAEMGYYARRIDRLIRHSERLNGIQESGV